MILDQEDPFVQLSFLFFVLAGGSYCAAIRWGLQGQQDKASIAHVFLHVFATAGTMSFYLHII